MVKMTERSTTDLLILMIAGTICFAVLATGATVGIIEIANSRVDTSGIVNQLSDVINTLIGLLAGFLAGRAHAIQLTDADAAASTRESPLPAKASTRDTATEDDDAAS